MSETKYCKFFQQGNCKYDKDCKFKHELKPEQKLQQKPKNKLNKKPKKNTETFVPSHKPRDMTIHIADTTKEVYNKEIGSRDVIIANNLFCQIDDLDIYNKLLEEIKNSGKEENGLWKLWHGDTHLIADDHLNWKKHSPTFNMIIDKLSKYFNMDVKATRLNWYRDSKEWKPYHFDAAAVDDKKAKVQNFTVGVSFGATREAAFEHAKTKTTVGIPLVNGSTYCFSKDVNIEWRHGIPQLEPEKQNNDGRISVIAWGYVTLK
jgi:hypothetical protein